MPIDNLAAICSRIGAFSLRPPLATGTLSVIYNCVPFDFDVVTAVCQLLINVYFMLCYLHRLIFQLPSDSLVVLLCYSGSHCVKSIVLVTGHTGLKLYEV